MERTDPTNGKNEPTDDSKANQYPSEQRSHPINESNKKELRSKEPQTKDDTPIRDRQPQSHKAELPFTETASKMSPMTPDTQSTISSGPQVFIVRPLPNLPSPTFKLQEGLQTYEDKAKENYANLQSIQSNASKGWCMCIY